MDSSFKDDLPIEVFSEDIIKTVWGKAIPILPKLSYDCCHNMIDYDRYGDRYSKFGWEIDMIRPRWAGGTDDIDNFQPLQWEEKRNKGDSWPWIPKRK